MNKCTLKQKKFAKEIVMGKDPGNATQAAFDTYNVKNRYMAGKIGSANLQKPHIMREIETLMDKHNITDDFMMERLKEGLNAKVVANYKGKAIQTDIPDQAVRHKYFQDAAKFKEMYPADKLETRNLNIDVMVESMDKKELARLLKDQLKQLSGK